MTALFTYNQIDEIEAELYKIRSKKMAEKLEPFVAGAVEFYAKEMRTESDRMLDELKQYGRTDAFFFKSYDFSAIPGRGNAVTKWKRPSNGTEENAMLDTAYAEFSHTDRVCLRDPRGTMFGVNGVRESMWRIWRWTDFRTRLLAELGLDSKRLDHKHFEFKIRSSQYQDNERLFKNDDIPEYHNTVFLMYNEFPKKN